jgi:hypothetical protein
MIESGLVSGQSAIEIARKFDVDADVISEINKVVKGRAEAVAGEDLEVVSDVLDVPIAVLDEELYLCLPHLAKHWAAIEGEGNLDKIGQDILVPVGALERLRQEIRAKAQLAKGLDPAQVAADSGRTLEDVASWNVEVADARGDLAILKRDGTAGTSQNMAAQLRLPLAVFEG